MTAASVLREHPEPYAQATCVLPICGEPLHIEHTTTSTVYLSDTAVGLASLAGDVETWAVVCEGGHTILVPVDTGRDSYTFGVCQDHDGDEDPHTEECDDLARLRRVIAEQAALA